MINIKEKHEKSFNSNKINSLKSNKNIKISLKNILSFQF